jgi:hypothetical protein
MGRARPLRQWGAVLLGVIILAALLLIGAATIGIIYVRQLNQQRQVQTRGHLETAFQGLFPGNLRKRANLNSDFGYDPNVKYVPPLGHDLRLLVDRARVVDSDTVTAHANVAQWSGTSTETTATLNAWNGPYWNGPVDGANRPVDGWGRPLQLRWISTSTPPGWQVFSVGANGVSETGDAATPSGDDQVFPASPYVVPVVSTSTLLTCAPLVQVNYTTNGAEQIRITVTDGAGAVYASGQQTVNKNNSFSYSPTITSGTVTIVVEKKPGGSWIEIYNVTSTMTTCTTLTINLP